MDATTLPAPSTATISVPGVPSSVRRNESIPANESVNAATPMKTSDWFRKGRTVGTASIVGIVRSK